MAGNYPATLSSISNPPPKRSNQHSKSQNPINPLLTYHQTLAQGRFPDTPTLIFALRSCAHVSAFEAGQTIHSQIIKTRSRPDRFIATSLIRFYSACGHISFAYQVFDEITEKDAALRTAMLSGFSLNGAIENARHVFDEMPERDIVAWNAMLSGYAQSGLPQAALELFREMQIANFRPNEVTLVSALSACSQLGSLAVGKWIHTYIDRYDSISATSTLNNSLAHMYAKCGRLDAAFHVFVERRPRNLESWNTMLTSFAIHGCGSAALSLFSQMMRMGLTPDRISFVGLLMACSHGGMIDHATRCFDCMNRVYGIKPKSEHYGCMVDVLSRGGFLEEAQLLIDRMPFEPDAYVWGALLGGCLTHKNYELGLHTAKCLLKVEPDEESRYIALLNLHAMSGKREDATMVRNTMIDMGVNKSSGSSKIEINGIVLEFFSGDGSHYLSTQYKENSF